MINKKTNTNGFSSFGFSTILLCFVMICVVIFSVLSLVTANSDYKLSQKVAQKTKAYYEAEIHAYEKLAMIDSILVEYYETSPSKSAYYANLEGILTEYGTFENETTECYLSFIVPVENNQYLSIKIAIGYPIKNTDSFYKIIEWRSMYEKELSDDDNLNLFQ